MVTDPKGFGDEKIEIEPEMLEVIANFANGDARSALSTLEMVVLNGETDGDTIRVTSETSPSSASQRNRCFTTRRARSIII